VALRPVGDLPPSVYWVRRLILLGVIVVIVAIVWWLLANGDDGTESTAAEPTSSASVSDSPSPTTSLSPTDSQTSQKPKPATTPRCRDADIQVTVATSAETYTADEQPEITFEVENVSDEACSRDIGQAANELQVTSGGSQVWSSDDCNPGGEEELDDLKPGDRFVQTVTWARVQSSEGCPTPQEPATEGTYQVIARNGDVLSEPASFDLE